MEEHVGELWDRLISRVADKRYPQAAVALPQLKAPLGLFFRALGGDGGLHIEAADSSDNHALRSWLQRLAGTNTKHWQARRNAEALQLPPEIDCFEDSRLNRDLYYWLTAIAACSEDITFKHHHNLIGFNQALTTLALHRFPGLHRRYHALVENHLAQRPALDSLKPGQRPSEQLVRMALLEPGSVHVTTTSIDKITPVPLWLYPPDERQGTSDAHEADGTGSSHSKAMRDLDDIGKRKAERVDEPDKDRGLITVRMENIFTMGEFVNVDRGSEEEDDIDRSEDVARELDTLSISKESSSTTATLKFDLDLPAAGNDDAIICDGLMLPEWNWKTASLQADHCHIVQMVADKALPCELPAHLSRTARHLRKQFQALAPARQWLNRQRDGTEIDIDACIRYQCDRSDDLHGKHVATDANLYREMRTGERDLSCLLLADLSLSTDTWINDQNRIIDVIRDSLFLFAECLHANGDRFALHGFSSRKRDPVRVHTIKGFDESYNAGTRGRIAVIKPGYYTRLGAGIRFASQQLIEQGNGRRLLLVLTDGKPNDLDQYEGRYGIEDTRHAIMAARRAGLLPFCVTIDTKGNDYLPHLFGKNNYVVIRDPARLPRELPRLYAQFSQHGD